MTDSKMLWFDLETTGLDPEQGLILEYGLVVTDGIGGPEIDHLSIPVRHNFVPVIPTAVMQMHLESGLWDDIITNGVHRHAASNLITAFLDRHFSDDTPITVGGSGIDRFDIPWLRWHTPGLADRFHWRTIDVSVVKRLMHLAGIEPAPIDGVQHRAVDDARWASNVAAQAVELLRNPAIIVDGADL